MFPFEPSVVPITVYSVLGIALAIIACLCLSRLELVIEQAPWLRTLSSKVQHLISGTVSLILVVTLYLVDGVIGNEERLLALSNSFKWVFLFGVVYNFVRKVFFSEKLRGTSHQLLRLAATRKSREEDGAVESPTKKSKKPSNEKDKKAVNSISRQHSFHKKQNAKR